MTPFNCIRSTIVLLVTMAGFQPAQAAKATRDIYIEASPTAVWDAMRDVSAADRRLAPGLIVSDHLDGDVRTLTFANGRVLQEKIILIDDHAKRLTFRPLGDGATYRRSSMRVLASGHGTRLVWATNVHPDSLVTASTASIEKILAAIKANLER